MVNNSNDGIAVVDKNGHFLVFNQVLVELLGCGPLDSYQYDWSKSFNIYYR
ncbi:MAG: PAS domain-containing protein, partial [Mucilaginibacter sp.]